MAKITKDMIIKDIININMGCIPILLNEGMHCVGCQHHREKHWKKHVLYTDWMQMYLQRN